MIKLTLYDGVIPLLDELVSRKPGFAREALQAAGAKLMKRARDEMMKEKTVWHQTVKNGRRKIYRGAPTTLGRRMSHKTGETLDPENMKSFITFYMSPKNPTVVTVGGAHKDFYPLKYRNGEVVGSMGKIGGVGKIGRSIIHKLDTGRLDSHHPYKEKSWIPNAKYPSRGFMSRAFFGSRTEIENTVIDRFRSAFGGAVKTIRTKVTKRDIA